MPTAYELKRYKKGFKKSDFSSYVLGADVGGTATRFGLAGVQNTSVTLLLSLTFHSQQLPALLPALTETLKYIESTYQLTPDATCIAAPGVISADKTSAALPNITWDIDLSGLQEHTVLEDIALINDFQAVGYGLNLLNEEDPNDFVTIAKGKSRLDGHLPKAAIGAGTGLGKTLLLHQEHNDAYLPHPSEGGHSEIPVYDMNELGLLRYIQRTKNISYPIYYDEVVSGPGIANIYRYLRNQKNIRPTRYTAEIDRAADPTPLIARYRKVDNTCSETFHLFTRFYARCAKNFILDTLAVGGLYIAGGIAAKNPDIFQTAEFLYEFTNSPYQKEVLSKPPIKVVINTTVGLLGACFAAQYHH